MKQIALEELKARSIAIKKPIEVRWPQFSCKKLMHPEIYFSFEHCYNKNAHVIAFVDGKILFVTPYTTNAERCLKDNNFTLKAMDVPFSHGEYPLKEKDKWIYLEHEACKTALLNFTDSCIEYCDNHNIGALNDSLLKKCFEMPRDGVAVFKTVEDIYFPILIGFSFNVYTTHMLGTYNVRKATCIFVYRDGRTFVTKDSEVIGTLPKLNYVLAGLTVPFTCNEHILDSEVEAKLKSLGF